MFLFCSVYTNALVYTTNSYQNSPYNNSRIGYTTNLHVQYETCSTIGSSFSSGRTYNINQIQQQYDGAYKPFGGAYDVEAYNGYNSYENSTPRKAAKAAGGSGSYGGITVTYTVEADYWGILYYTVTYYYPDGTVAGTERIRSIGGVTIDYDHLNSQAEKYAKEYYERQMSAPIGDIPFMGVFCVAVGYGIVKSKKKKS